MKFLIENVLMRQYIPQNLTGFMKTVMFLIADNLYTSYLPFKKHMNNNVILLLCMKLRRLCAITNIQNFFSHSKILK